MVSKRIVKGNQIPNSDALPALLSKEEFLAKYNSNDYVLSENDKQILEKLVNEYILSEKEKKEIDELVEWCFNPEKDDVVKK